MINNRNIFELLIIQLIQYNLDENLILGKENIILAREKKNDVRLFL